MSLRHCLPTALLLLVGASTSAAPSGRLDLPDAPQLAARAADVTELTLPGAVLGLAALLDTEADPALQQTLAHLDSVRIRSYSFHEDHAYAEADVDSIRRQLGAAHWSALVHTHDRAADERADIYLCIDGASACGVAILVTAPREFTVVNLVGHVPLADAAALGRQWQHAGAGR